MTPSSPLRSTRAAIGFGVLLVVLVALVPLWVGAPRQVERDAMTLLASRLEVEAKLVAEAVRPALERQNPEAVREVAAATSAASGLRVIVRDAKGGVLVAPEQSGQAVDPGPETSTALAGDVGSNVRRDVASGRDYLHVAVPVGDARAPLGAIEVATDLAAVDRIQTSIAESTALALVVAAVLAAALSFWLSSRITRPLTALARAADQVASGRYGYDAIPGGASEAEQLGRAFGRMAKVLQSSFAVVEAERDRLDAVLRHMADGILIADADGVVTLVNPAAGRILGIDARRAVGRRLASVARDHEILDVAHSALAAAGQRRDFTATVERASPRRYLRAVATRVGEGHSRQLLLVLQDLTEFRRLETMRRDFLANVSHELRTPIAAIKAMVETLEDGAIDDPPAARDFLGRMRREADGLAHLVEELLQLSRIESGQLGLQPKAIAPVEIANRTVERLAPLAERAGVTLTVEAGEDLPPVWADHDRVTQVLTNIVHNAIKFTPPTGRVVVKADGGAGEVVFSVSDTGAGIAEEDIPRLFERFYKADKARTSGGTGLGLAIAKHLVQAHGGRIWAESAGPGQGATFRFTLPVAPPSEQTPGS